MPSTIDRRPNVLCYPDSSSSGGGSSTWRRTNASPARPFFLGGPRRRDDGNVHASQTKAPDTRGRSSARGTNSLFLFFPFDAHRVRCVGCGPEPGGERADFPLLTHRSHFAGAEENRCGRRGNRQRLGGAPRLETPPPTASTEAGPTHALL